MKKNSNQRKLKLSTETLQRLTSEELAIAIGGAKGDPQELTKTEPFLCCEPQR
jgi:hypothetical protein